MSSSPTRARRFRSRPTFAEARLWSLLRDRRFLDLKFRRQAPVGRWTVDFVCYEANLVIEVDGGVHKLTATADQERDAELARMGLRVLRVPNEAVVSRPDEVLHAIARATGRRSEKPLGPGA